MRHIFISAGHSNDPKQDRGAYGCSYWEGDLTVELRDLINMYLNDACVLHTSDANKSVTAKTINTWKLLTKPDSIVMDIHFNAATPQATGVEIIIDDQYTIFEMEFAQALVDGMSKILGIKNRGVKREGQTARKKLGWFSLSGENVLLEVCFISNQSDMDAYQLHKEELAKFVADTLVEWGGK